jgi:16S rRNA (uracil1498-N3)-methyltransferase
MGRVFIVMRRYWIDKEKIQGKLVSIDGDLFHHLTEVCRLSEGATFELLCGDQRAYRVRMTERTRRLATAEILEERELAPIPLPHLHLAVSIPRFQKLDVIIEKCVELGVRAVHPFVSDYSFVRKVDGSLTDKAARWDRIVKAATRQSGRGDLMEISKPVNLAEIADSINRNPNASGLFSYEGEAALDLKTAVRQMRRGDLREVWMIVGSEGGFSGQEVDFLGKKGFEPVTLGDQVLRVETACLALVSIIKYEFA